MFATPILYYDLYTNLKPLCLSYIYFTYYSQRMLLLSLIEHYFYSRKYETSGESFRAISRQVTKFRLISLKSKTNVCLFEAVIQHRARSN